MLMAGGAELNQAAREEKLINFMAVVVVGGWERRDEV